MRVWQPGSHLVMDRGTKVEDWSWRQTARRVGTLARLARPYRLQTTLAVVSLLGATLTQLAPPYFAKRAIDDGIRPHDLHALTLYVLLFLVAGIANWGMSAAQTYYT